MRFLDSIVLEACSMAALSLTLYCKQTDQKLTPPSQLSAVINCAGKVLKSIQPETRHNCRYTHERCRGDTEKCEGSPVNCQEQEEKIGAD